MYNQLPRYSNLEFAKPEGVYNVNNKYDDERKMRALLFSGTRYRAVSQGIGNTKPKNRKRERERKKRKRMTTAG